MVDFHTPHDMIRLEEAIFSAASSGMVRGSAIVTEKNTQLLVHEGTLRVASKNGSQLVSQGNAIQLASSAFAPEGTAGGGAGTAGAGAGAAAAGGAGFVTTGTVVGVSAAAMVAGAVTASNAADGGGEVSPSAPASLR